MTLEPSSARLLRRGSLGLGLLMMLACDRGATEDAEHPVVPTSAPESVPTPAPKAKAPSVPPENEPVRAPAPSKAAKPKGSAPPSTAVSEPAPEVAGVTATASAGPVLGGGVADPPVRLLSLSLEPDRLVTGEQYGSVRVLAEVELRRRTRGDLTLEAVCALDEQLVVDEAELSDGDGNTVRDLRRGQTATQGTALFMQGLDRVPAPCQLSLRLDDAKGRPAIELGHACWKDGALSPGECSPAIAMPMSVAASKATTVRFGKVTDSVAYGGSMVALSQRITFHEPPASDSTLEMQATCEIDGKRRVDVASTYYPPEDTRIRPGQTKGRRYEMFEYPGSGFARRPEVCELTTSMWSPVAGRGDRLEQVIVDRSCLRGLSISAGPCDPGVVLHPPGTAAITATNTTIDQVKIWTEPSYDGKSVSLLMTLDATPSERLALDQRLYAELACQVGGKRREHRSELSSMRVQLRSLQPGETVGLDARISTEDPAPDRCTTTITAGADPKAATEIATYCLEGTAATAGACGSTAP